MLWSRQAKPFGIPLIQPEAEKQDNLMKQTAFHVDGRTGDANGDGSAEAPFATIQQAADRMAAGDTCFIHAGIYRETVTPACSGTETAPLTFRASGDGDVTLTGCNPVGDWHDLDGIWHARVPLLLEDENQVFFGDTMMCEARWPALKDATCRGLLEFETAEMSSGTTPTCIVDPSLPDIDWAGARVWVSSYRRWYCWTGDIIRAEKGRLHVVDNSDRKGNHVCMPGGRYYVFGTASLLRAPNQWSYDSAGNTLKLIPPDGTHPAGNISVKARRYAFDLRGRQHIHLRGLNIFAASIHTDDHSRHLHVDGLRMRYVHHSSRAEQQYGSQVRSGVILNGQCHTVKNSEIAYSSGSCLVLAGDGCRVVNNHIHDADYIGGYAAGLVFQGGGSGHLVSHNTIERAGRSPVAVQGLHDSLLQHNDLGFAGFLTWDLGLTYGNGVEGGNSEVRYNWFHDTVCDEKNFGFYIDHGCKNALVHHNVIWNVRKAGLQINQYANYILYEQNTVIGSEYSFQSAWAAGQEKDLYGCRLVGNLSTAAPHVDGAGLVEKDNQWNCPLPAGFHSSPIAGRQLDGTALAREIASACAADRDCGACAADSKHWTAGCDLENPPGHINATRTRHPYENKLSNTAFLRGQLAGWTATGPEVTVVSARHGQWTNDAQAMMGGCSVKLGPGVNSLHQDVRGLSSGAMYELMAMFRVDPGEAARLEVIHPDGSKTRSREGHFCAPHWIRLTLRFETSRGQSSVRAALVKSSAGAGSVFVDDPGLQLVE